MGSSGDRVHTQFPAGLRVLVVDDDLTCLKIIEKMLHYCLYEVTTCSQAVVALSILRERKYMFDIVLSDVHMPDMDGFKLLEHIGLEMDLPVIMMSMDDKKEVVMKGVTHGACDFLIKPIRMEAIKNIWQHVVRKRKNELRELEQSGSVEESERNRRPSEDADNISSANEESWRNSKKRRDDEDELDERDDSSSLKKPRVVWSVELHQQFVAAVNQLSIDKAVPKKILELMNVPGLTRENVASHLQKYRLYLKRLSGGSQNEFNSPFMGPGDASFAHMSSLDGFNLQALTVPSQPQNSLSKLQAGGGLANSTPQSGINLQIADQRNMFGVETPRSRFGVGQQLSNNNQVNILRGIPITMDPKQLTNLQQSVPSFGSSSLQGNEDSSSFMKLPMGSLGTSSSTRLDPVQRNDGNPLMMQMAQSQFGGKLFPNEIHPRILGPNGTLSNGRSSIQPQVSQSSPFAGFSTNHASELPGLGFAHCSSSGVTGFRSVGMYQGGGSSGVKGPREYNPSYDIFNELQHNNRQSNIGSSFSGLDQQNIFSNPKTEDGTQQELAPRVPQCQENLQFQNDFKLKGPSVMPFNNDNFNFTNKHWGQDDLMSAILKQQQEGAAPVENELNFDGFPMDNISV